MAVAKISHYYIRDDSDLTHGISLYKQMTALRAQKNFANWWEIKYGYDAQTNEVRKEKYGTTDTMTIARARSVQAKGNEYVDGNRYRTETLTLHGFSIATSGNGNTTGSVRDQRVLDSLFIDLKADRKDSSISGFTI